MVFTKEKNPPVFLLFIAFLIILSSLSAAIGKTKKVKPGKTVKAFDVEFSIPKGAHLLPLKNLSTMKYLDPKSGISFGVERRGNGSFARTPIPLKKLSSMASAALGVQEPVPTTSMMIDGQPAEEARFDNGYQRFITFTVFHGGYIYLFFSGDEGTGNEAFEEYAAAFSKSISFPFSFPSPVSKKSCTFSDLGLVFTGDESLISDSTGKDFILSLIDPDNKVTMTVTRLPADPFVGPEFDNELLIRLMRGMCNEIDGVKPGKFGGRESLRFQCSKGARGGGVNFSVTDMVIKDNFLYIFQAISDASRKDALLEFSQKMGKEIGFK